MAVNTTASWTIANQLPAFNRDYGDYEAYRNALKQAVGAGGAVPHHLAFDIRLAQRAAVGEVEMLQLEMIGRLAGPVAPTGCSSTASPAADSASTRTATT